MLTPYERAMTLSTVAPGRRSGQIDPSWNQGRGSFGGLLAASGLRAMIEDVADPARIPRSLTVHFCAPATGAFELSTEIVRVGSRVTHATARFENETGVVTFASASFCKDRQSAEHYALASMPDVAPASRLVALRPEAAPGVPAFFAYVDARFCGDTLPFSSSKEARVAAWVRLREPAPLDAPLAALLLDTLPPAVSVTLAAPRPVASVDFTVHFFAHLDPAPGGAPSDEHQLVAIRSRWADAGYTEELRELWSPRGLLLAQCRQLVALI